MEKERPSGGPVFGLSLLGYCRNVEVQNVKLLGRGPTLSVDICNEYHIHFLPLNHAHWTFLKSILLVMLCYSQRMLRNSILI